MNFNVQIFLKQFLNSKTQIPLLLDHFSIILKKTESILALHSKEKFAEILRFIENLKLLQIGIDSNLKTVQSAQTRFKKFKKTHVFLPRAIKNKIFILQRKKIILNHLVHLRSFKDAATIEALNAQNFKEKWKIMNILTKTPIQKKIEVLKCAENHIYTFQMDIIKKSNSLFSERILDYVNSNVQSEISSKFRDFYKITKTLLPSKNLHFDEFQMTFWRFCKNYNLKLTEKVFESSSLLVKQIRLYLITRMQMVRSLKDFFMKLASCLIVHFLTIKTFEFHLNENVHRFLLNFADIFLKCLIDTSQTLFDCCQKNAHLISRKKCLFEIFSINSDLIEVSKVLFVNEFHASPLHLNIVTSHFSAFTFYFDSIRKAISIKKFEEHLENIDHLITSNFFSQKLIQYRLQAKSEIKLRVHKTKLIICLCLGLKENSEIIFEDSKKVIVISDENDTLLILIDTFFQFFLKNCYDLLILYEYNGRSRKNISDFFYEFYSLTIQEFKKVSLNHLNVLLTKINQLKTIEFTFKNLVVRQICDDFEKNRNLNYQFKILKSTLEDKFAKWLDQTINFEVTVYANKLQKCILEKKENPYDGLIVLFKNIRKIFYFFDQFYFTSLKQQALIKIKQTIDSQVYFNFEKISKNKNEFRSEIELVLNLLKQFTDRLHLS